MTRSPRGKTERLDLILVERGLAPTRSRANALILSGRVRLGTDRLTKPGQRYDTNVELTVDEGRRYVGRGAYKLQAALRSFAIDVQTRDCIDVGASTGGFTEVLLLHGAGRVVALDVGRGQLDWTLRQDDRVLVLEGVNARYLDAAELPFAPSLATIDVSFISLELILRPVIGVLDGDRPCDVIALVKPQFEVGRGKVGRGGIVRDPDLHREVLEQTILRAADAGCAVVGVIASPITGAEGNREFLLHLRPGVAEDRRSALNRAVESALVCSDPAEGAR